jgi:chorismate synthase
MTTGLAALAVVERSDVCAVPAAAVVGEAVVALVLAEAFLETFGGDSAADIGRTYDAWCRARAAQFAGGPAAPGKDSPTA